jgi:transcriptional regulator with XRE-family HTH domain
MDAKCRAEAAKVLGVTQARVSDLKRGKIDRFSMDLLMRLAARAGLKPKLKFAAQAGSLSLRKCPETATIWRGHDWGHRRIRAILLVYKSMSYGVNVVATRPTSKYRGFARFWLSA